MAKRPRRKVNLKEVHDNPVYTHNWLPKLRQYEPDYQPDFNFREMKDIVADARDKKTEIFAYLLEVNRQQAQYRKRFYNHESYLAEVGKHQERSEAGLARMREDGLFDSFGTAGIAPALGLVGDDFVPLIAGPINKQQYLQSYLQGQQESFFAYHHDPFCRGAVNVLKHFTIGKGFKAESDNEQALALWKAFSQVNKIPEMLNYMAIEIPICGEIMPYWIPNRKTYVSVDNRPGLEPPQGFLPRVRLLDVSAIWEIITLPEDVMEVFAYQQVYISQYQYYSTQVNGDYVPISKTIIRQLPADEVNHYKVNCLSGEKRGRSDMYPVLGFAKRLRDTIQYAVIQAQKQAAFSFDTMVDGSPDDIQAYANAVSALGQMPPAGTERIHSKKVETKIMEATGGGNKDNSAFEWCLSAFCAGFGIPMNFLGTHLSGGQTRASALTATEPTYKRFEERQLLYKQILQDMAQKLFKMNNIEAEIEFIFPDLLNQDRTAKINQLLLAQEAGWLSRERCANMVAAEMGIANFKFDQEKTEAPPEEEPHPLSEPGSMSGSGMGGGMSGGMKSSVRSANA